MPPKYKVIDLFAGPGGLAEGFASVVRGGRRPFEIALSVEKDAAAHATLRLRAFVRQFDGKPPPEYLKFLGGTAPQPDWSLQYPEQWTAAEAHALCLELGRPDAAEALRPRLEALAGEETIVIGGPPCQAYSVVGRVRNQGTEGYEAREDARHFLYKEYIGILRQVRPVAFVMENVKGLLSSKVDGVRILDAVLEDLRGAGGSPDSYRLVSLAPVQGKLIGDDAASGADFLLRSEDHGVPQARHRMIIVGIRADRANALGLISGAPLMRSAPAEVTVGQALSGLPDLRSGLTRGDAFQAWRDAVVDAMDLVLKATAKARAPLLAAMRDEAAKLRNTFWIMCPVLPRGATVATSMDKACPPELVSWLEGVAGGRVANHETRPHMPSDLSRYFFAAVFGRVHGRSPKAHEYPKALAPKHRNWTSGDFKDRFRVQIRDKPSTTITSHISKDGHYFIHPDPLQCRALTVREAARLQTFPDDYVFLGGRTQQYVQVGNAVPPYLAHQIGEALARILESEISQAPAQAGAGTS